ncbi:MAG: YkvA family protein [Armatimonadota bacterium]
MRQPSGIGFAPGRMDTWRLLVHLPNFVKLYTRLWKDKRVSWVARAVLIAGALYAIVPIDAITDFLAPLGLTDDLAVVTATLWAFVKLCPRRVVAEHVEIIDQGG